TVKSFKDRLGVRSAMSPEKLTACYQVEQSLNEGAVISAIRPPSPRRASRCQGGGLSRRATCNHMRTFKNVYRIRTCRPISGLGLGAWGVRVWMGRGPRRRRLAWFEGDRSTRIARSVLETLKMPRVRPLRPPALQ